MRVCETAVLGVRESEEQDDQPWHSSRPPHRCYLILHLTAAAPIKLLACSGQGTVSWLVPSTVVLAVLFLSSFFKGRIKSRRAPRQQLAPQTRITAATLHRECWPMLLRTVYWLGILPGLLHQSAPGAQGLFRVSSLAPLDQIPKFKQDEVCTQACWHHGIPGFHHQWLNLFAQANFHGENS